MKTNEQIKAGEKDYLSALLHQTKQLMDELARAVDGHTTIGANIEAMSGYVTGICGILLEQLAAYDGKLYIKNLHKTID